MAPNIFEDNRLAPSIFGKVSLKNQLTLIFNV